MHRKKCVRYLVHTPLVPHEPGRQQFQRGRELKMDNGDSTCNDCVTHFGLELQNFLLPGYCESSYAISREG